MQKIVEKRDFNAVDVESEECLNKPKMKVPE